MQEFSLTLPAKIELLSLASHFSKEACKSLLNSSQSGILNDLELVVSEAFTNAVKYGGEGKGKVALEIKGDKQKLIICIKDQGKGFKLDKVPEPDFDNFAEGGYGLYIIQTKMDLVRYTCFKNWNVLHLTKYLNENAPGKD